MLYTSLSSSIGHSDSDSAAGPGPLRVTRGSELVPGRVGPGGPRRRAVTVSRFCQGNTATVTVTETVAVALAVTDYAQAVKVPIAGGDAVTVTVTACYISLGLGT
jgi:hypothetical protein